MTSETYNFVNNAWKQTTKVIFGESFGDMSDFEEYLKEPLVGKTVKSIFSGNDVFVTSQQYAKNSRFFDYNHEMGDATRSILSKPLDVNKIKDIDSLLEAINEKIVYSGNKILGNSHFVENSDNVTDSSYVYRSSMVVSTKYSAYCYMARMDEYCFASTSTGDSSMIIRCFYNNALKRCFECITTASCSDCYFCNNLLGSTNCMFSFHLRSSSNMIGNVQLTKDQYAALKSKLLAEVVSDLKRRKRTLSMMDLLGSEEHGEGVD